MGVKPNRRGGGENLLGYYSAIISTEYETLFDRISNNGREWAQLVNRIRVVFERPSTYVFPVRDAVYLWHVYKQKILSRREVLDLLSKILLLQNSDLILRDDTIETRIQQMYRHKTKLNDRRLYDLSKKFLNLPLLPLFVTENPHLPFAEELRQEKSASKNASKRKNPSPATTASASANGSVAETSSRNYLPNLEVNETDSSSKRRKNPEIIEKSADNNSAANLDMSGENSLKIDEGNNNIPAAEKSFQIADLLAEHSTTVEKFNPNEFYDHHTAAVEVETAANFIEIDDIGAIVDIRDPNFDAEDDVEDFGGLFSSARQHSQPPTGEIPRKTSAAVKAAIMRAKYE